MTVLDILHRH